MSEENGQFEETTAAAEVPEVEVEAETEMIDEGAPVIEETDPEEAAAEAEAEAAEPAADSEPAAEAEAETEEEVEEEVEAETDMVEEGAPVSEETDPEAFAAAALGDTEATDEDAEYRRRLREYTREMKKQPGKWYIIQTYAGYENKVKTNIDMRAQTLEVEDSIFDTVVPIEQAIEVKDGKRKVVKRKLLPGYVLVRMEMNDSAWSVVRETPGVTSFVGNEGNATPVKHRDVAKFLLPKETATEGEIADKSAFDDEGQTVIAMPDDEGKPKPTHDFQVGEAVTILSGALASVSATINSIDPETGKIQALVSIFGRETPVELTADQVERIN